MNSTTGCPSKPASSSTKMVSGISSAGRRRCTRCTTSSKRSRRPRRPSSSMARAALARSSLLTPSSPRAREEPNRSSPRITRVGGSQEIPIDIRIITATNRAPQQAVEDGKLREDLLFRLMTFPIYLPPLRERQGDILHLANTFLGQLNRREGTGKTFSKDAVDFLATSVWPGNVRELKNSVQYAYIVSGEQIEARHFPPASSSIAEESLSPLRFTLGTSLYDFEKRFILATLDHYNGDKRSAAEALGVSLKTLYNRLNNYQSPA